MIKQISQVKEFHEKFNIFIQNSPKIPKDDLQLIRKTLIAKEALEVSEAILERHDLDQITKELCDLLYVTYGTILTFGLQDKIEECFDEVHRSNMSKLGKYGKNIYRYDVKLLKGDNYSPADIKKILNVVE